MQSSGAIFVHSRYMPGGELGRGAQGVVVRVTDVENPAVPLVAKVWQGRCFHPSTLQGEFAILSRLRIPGLVRAHDWARCEKTGAPFLIENFVDGPDACDWLARVSDPGKGARVILVLTTISSTLARLHESGFLHGDLKPAHVRVVHAGQTYVPMLLDLGAAVSRARTESTTNAFTPGFAAPEVRAGATPSVESDLYSLGATVFAMVTGTAPGARPRRRFFEYAPWLPPSAATLIDDLLAEHPRDRPQSARDVLHRLGIARFSPGLPPLPMGRDAELAVLRQAKPTAVRWIVGPSGSGKTHLLRELHTQLLLDGRDVRLIRFPTDGETTGKLLAYLRGNDAALPFTFAHAAIEKPVVLLDETHLAPEEIHAALDAFRCRYAANPSRIAFIVATREAPRAAESTTLAPLDDHAFQGLCEGLGVQDRATIQSLALASGKNPGWLIAALGAIPLERDTALDRARTLSVSAQDLLAVFALSGGELPETVCRRILTSISTENDALAELSAAALITRHLSPNGLLLYSLYSPNLTRDLATALETPERSSLGITAWLAESYIPTTVLLALGATACVSPMRTRLLERAAMQSRVEGVRSQEIEALHALMNEESNRSVHGLLRLERLLRDGHGSAAYPRIIEWLDAAAKHDATILPLVLRRHAEKLAREGKTVEAAEVADRARMAAMDVNDHVSAALALATRGVAALYRADWEEAESCLGRARSDLENGDNVDKEELARIDHNVGVVALYRGRVAEAIAAFERALETKRLLGDRAGTRSCLLNLGLALSKSKRYDDAERVLQESLELARSLGQTTGQGWCLVARADVCIRQKDATKARQWLAEAMQLEASLPKPIQADLLLLQAEAALLVGDGQAATSIIENLDLAIRVSDALVDTRAFVLESRACLTRLPIAKGRAARLAIRAIRRARGAKLIEMETEATTALRAARSDRRPLVQSMHAKSTIETDLWPWLASVSTGISFDAATSSFAQLVIRVSGAERVFLATIDAAGVLVDAVGVDLDGLPLVMPLRRIAPDIVADALRTTNPILRRDIATSGHHGCRLAITGPKPENDGPRALLILEHRFLPTAFDNLSADLAQRWAILTGLLWAMFRARETRTSTADHDSSLSTSTTNSDTSQTTSAVRRAQTTYFPALEKRRQIPNIVGHSVALDRALMRLDAAIDSDLPVLIIGETGTGKELFARALHDFGRRCDEPFVAINCAAIPDSLFEAELFGHVRGSFTGAERARSGLLARAAKGTLFLDEIGELPLLRQATLLRVLQDRCYRPVGSDEEISFDVRIVAATNRDLTRSVENGTFRRDLLYRLNTLEISVPPLRERTGDIAELARLFLARAGSKASLSQEVIAALESYTWPGNVRELEHVMQRLAMQQVAVIERSFLPRELRASALPHPKRGRSPRERSLPPEDAARIEVEEALRQSQGNISRAASLLGLTRHGLKKRMVRLGLREPSSGAKQEA